MSTLNCVESVFIPMKTLLGEQCQKQYGKPDSYETDSTIVFQVFNNTQAEAQQVINVESNFANKPQNQPR